MANAKNLARTRDQFYTQEVVAEDCLKQLLPFLRKKDFIWLEPSAGQGAFLSVLEKNNYEYIAFDIEPKHPAIKLQDFLLTTKEDISQLVTHKSIVTIGNPPFGKNSSLAINFFNHAAQYSEYIGMIFPATFEKESVQKRLNKNMHLIKSIKLDNDKFFFDGKLVPVPTVFQIWKKEKEYRLEKNNKLISEHFQFVKKENADYAIQRVGVDAGKVKKDFAHLALSSHYFIKSNEHVYNIFKKIDWTPVKYNTAGNPSISKKELILLLEKSL